MMHLEVRDVVFVRENFELRTRLELERGKTGVILGPSGCGKTTLLRIIAGLETPKEGEIFLEGSKIDRLPPEKRKIGFVFQDLALFDHLTGKGNIEFGLKLHNVPRQESERRIVALAEKFQIGQLLARKPFAMSGGERQRLAFARALAIQPELLLLDEPLSSLDAPLRRELRGYLKAKLAQEGMTALHVTHDVEEALELADTIFLMNDGKILFSGRPEAIFAEPPDAWCVNFLGLGSLIPVDRVEFEGETAVSHTALGAFSCPRSQCKVAEGLAEKGKVFYFFPRKAARIVPHLEAGFPRGNGEGRNFIRAKVERVVFEGRLHRVSFIPEGKEVEAGGTASEAGGTPDAASASSDASGRASGGPDLRYEADCPPPFRFGSGDAISLFIDPSECRILPLHKH